MTVGRPHRPTSDSPEQLGFTKAKPVVLGPLDDGLRVIREGLKPQDRVIVDGLQRARVGAKVTPKEAPPAPAGGKT